MFEKRTALALTAVVLLIGLVAQAACAGRKARLGGDEDRPPIVIYENSIDFLHGYPWADQDGSKRVWRPNHPDGANVTKYEVDVTSNGADAGCGRLQGKVISIRYGERTFTLNLKRHGGGQKDEPELTSQVELTVDASGSILKYAGDGKISTIAVDNQRPCDVSQKPGIKISARPKHQ